MQAEKESVSTTMMRVQEAGPGLWMRTRVELEKQRLLLHERASFCARLMAEWAAAISAGDQRAVQQKPQEALAACYNSMTLQDWRQDAP